MSIADRIADDVGKKYAADSDDPEGAKYDEAETPDERQLECARDAVRAAKAGDAKAFLVAMQTLYAELEGGESPDAGEPPDED